MGEATNWTATAGVPATPGHAAGEGTSIMDVSFPLMLLTWGAFLAMSAILYKVAWKPILAGLSRREQNIRKALDDAERVRGELAGMEARGKAVLANAQHEAGALLDAARKASDEMVRAAESRARETAQEMLHDARREVEAATERARQQLRAESAGLVTSLAGRLVGENLDGEKNGALVRRWLEEG